MEHKDLVLRTLSQMAGESPQPTLYQFIPRELILRLPIDWSAIYSSLLVLEDEGAVQIFQADSLKFSITQNGVDKVKDLQSRETNKDQKVI